MGPVILDLHHTRPWDITAFPVMRTFTKTAAFLSRIELLELFPYEVYIVPADRRDVRVSFVTRKGHHGRPRISHALGKGGTFILEIA